MERPCSTMAVTKSSKTVISTASSAISSANAGGDHDHALAIAHHDVAGPDRRVAAADRHIDVDRLVERQVGRRGGAMVIGGDRQLGDLRAVAKAAVGDDAGNTATISRDTRMPPAEAARASLRLSITITAPGGHSSTALRCGWPRSWNTEIGFRSSRARDVAQGEGLADHGRQRRVQRPDVLDELVAQAALEQGRTQGRRRDAFQLVAGFGLQAHVRLPSAQKITGSATGPPKLVLEKVEVAALVGLLDVLGETSSHSRARNAPSAAARRRGAGRAPRR
jgi:hypothetical protein